MTEWRKPNPQITDYRYTAIVTIQKDEEGDEYYFVGIYFFEKITNTFIKKDGADRIKFKDIVLWHPLPDLPREVTV